MCDEIAVFPFLFELALTIAIPTVLSRNRHHPASSNLHRLNALDIVLGLNAISPNVLYGTGSHITWYQRKVLQSVKPSHERSLDHLVEHLTTATGHSVVSNLYTKHIRAHHDTLVILRQQQVTATTYYYIRCMTLTQNPRHLLCLSNRLVLQEAAALGFDAKCVVRFQTIIS